MARQSWRFDDFELDAVAGELRCGGEPRPVEPKVFELLTFLVSNAGRLLSKDELVESVWRGRVVSDSAVASGIKLARQALGDDGRRQRFIRTVHGRGVRFEADVRTPTDNPPAGNPGDASRSGARAPAAAPAPAAPDATAAPTMPAVQHAAPPARPATGPMDTRPAIAVLPFQLLGDAGAYAPIAEALPHELISELARLRWLFVIARGSAFRFRGADVALPDLARALNVTYCLTGTVEVMGSHIAFTAELADVRDGEVMWAERFAADISEIHDVRRRIVQEVVAALDVRVSAHEARRAQLRAPDSLDAWSAYHLGLQHMYRFTRDDNLAAQSLFSRAVRLEPGFCRAHAGLSFTHFQNAFLHYVPDVAEARRLAERHAERSVELDALDPFANLSLGRYRWLAGDLDTSRVWLARATELCPNYAKSLYAQALVETLAGNGSDGERLVDSAIALSPLDPLLYGMRGVRALSYLVRGETDSAMAWSERAARTPGAHALIDVIAALTHSLGSEHERADGWLRKATHAHPGLTQADFFAAFPFADAHDRARFGAALTRAGLR